MPLAAAVVGSAIIGGVVSSNAASKASKAATKAADQNAALETAQYNQTRADLQPYAQAGTSALSALQQRLGLSQPATSPVAPGTSTGAPIAGATGVPSLNVPSGWTAGAGLNPGAPSAATPTAARASMTNDQAARVLADRPDVASSSWLNSVDPNVIGDRTGDGQVDQSDRAAYWADNYAKQDGYTVPAATPSPATQPAASTIPGQTLTQTDRPDAAPRATMERPTFSEAQPTIGTGPMSSDYVDPSKFTTSPGYQFRLDQGLQGVNAGYAARGLLKSGGAMKGINDYAQGAASSEYGNWFNQGMAKLGADQGQYNNDRATSLAQYNQNRNVFNTNYNADTARYDNNYNTDRAYADNNYNTDRAYNTDLYNNYTGNLFNMAGIGQGAAAGTAAAGNNYVNGMTATNNNAASIKGNAAIAGANGISSAVNGAATAYGMYSNPFSVSGGGGGTGGGWLPTGISY